MPRFLFGRVLSGDWGSFLPSFKHVHEKEGDYEIVNRDLRIKGGSGYGYCSGYVSKPLMKYLASGEIQKIREDESEPMASGGRIKDLDQHWKRLLMNSFYDEEAALVEKRVQPYKTRDIDMADDIPSEEMIQNEYPLYWLSGITWVTERKHEEMTFTHLAYGNEATLSTQYCCMSLLAVIPPAEKRKVPV